MQDPFGRPCRVPDEIFVCAPGKRVFPVGIIMAELVYIRISLIRDPLPVAVDIYPGKGCCFHAVFADIPHLVEHRVGADERTYAVIKIVPE